MQKASYSEDMETVMATDGRRLSAYEGSKPRRIVCAVGPGDTAALQMAGELSKRWGAKLFVVHVVPEMHEGILATGFDQNAPLSEKAALEFLEQMKARAGEGGDLVHAESIVRTGQVRRVVHEVAKSLGADTLVTGRKISSPARTRERKPLLRWDWLLSLLGFDPATAGW